MTTSSRPVLLGANSGPLISPIRGPLDTKPCVTERTRKLVQIQSEQIMVNKILTKDETRRRIASNFKILKDKNKHKKLNSIHDWQRRTAKSPYTVNLYQAEQKMAALKLEIEKKKLKLFLKEDEINKMTGVPKRDECSEEFIASVEDPELQLAFEYRKSNRTYSILREEEERLTELLNTEYQKATKKFPYVLQELQRSRQNTAPGRISKNQANNVFPELGNGAFHNVPHSVFNTRRVGTAP